MNSRRGGKHLAHLVIHHRGRKGVKDAALAEACGFTEVEQMYRLLGRKLLLLSRSCWFELQPDRRNSGKDQAYPVNVFTLSGVIMITTWLATERALKVGMALVPLLGTRRRASKNKQRRPRRAADPPRQAKYQSALARLQIEWSKLEKKLSPAR
jgi:hypothetical protein